jgi:hypothetical protein
MRPRLARDDIELAIRPHPARPNWRVLRVSYAACPEHDARIAAALDAIFAPAREPAAEADRQAVPE